MSHDDAYFDRGPDAYTSEHVLFGISVLSAHVQRQIKKRQMSAMAAWAGTVTLTGSRVGLTGNNELRGFYPNSDLNVHNDTS